MSIPIPQWLGEQLEQIEWQNEPAWLIDFKKRHKENFIQTGLPSRRHERWKHANLTDLENKKFEIAQPCTTVENMLHEEIEKHRLTSFKNNFIVCVNGFYMRQLSRLDSLPDGVIVCSLSVAVNQYQEIIRNDWPQQFDAHRYPLTNLNVAFARDGLFIFIPDHCQMDSPVHILSVITNQCDSMMHPHHMIILGKASQLCILDEIAVLSEHVNWLNHLTTVVVHADAKLEYVKRQKQHENLIHYTHTTIEQQENSVVNYVDFSVHSRHDLHIKLNRYATCATSGFYYLKHSDQYVDHQVDIEHCAPNGKSEMLYKGILDNKSRAVFHGRVRVASQAQQTSAYQANHHLLLNQQAEAYSKPELEIYANDVQCKHGATSGELDEDALFYLRSRGMSYHDAVQMLLQGFAQDVLSRIEHDGIREYIHGVCHASHS